MIEKPDVPDTTILEALEECFSIREATLEFLPEGLDADAWAYRVEASGRTYFLKVSRGLPRETGAWMPAYLAEHGLPHVIAPIPTNRGEAQARRDDLTFRLQPYIVGSAAREAGMSGENWRELGAFLRRLHCLELPPEIRSRLRQETFVPRRLSWVTEMQARIGAAANSDPIAMEMLALWREKREIVSTLIERTRALMNQVQQETRPMVLCHADIHTGNVLLGRDRSMHVIDWDDAMLAPKERDLMFVVSDVNPSEMHRFFEGYGHGEIDRLVLAYCQHDWCIEEIGAFAEEILNVESSSGKIRENALAWFKHLFVRGECVATALASDVPVAVAQGARSAPGRQA